MQLGQRISWPEGSSLESEGPALLSTFNLVAELNWLCLHGHAYLGIYQSTYSYMYPIPALMSWIYAVLDMGTSCIYAYTHIHTATFWYTHLALAVKVSVHHHRHSRNGLAVWCWYCMLPLHICQWQFPLTLLCCPTWWKTWSKWLRMHFCSASRTNVYTMEYVTGENPLSPYDSDAGDLPILWLYVHRWTATSVPGQPAQCGGITLFWKLGIMTSGWRTTMAKHLVL